ncbi:hypothetical protein D3C72_1630910 [compost metagenome]
MLLDEVQRLQRIDRDARGGGEIIGGAQRHQPQRRQRVGGLRPVRQGLGHFAQGAVAAGGDDGVHAVFDRLGHVTLGIAVFPGHPHLQLDTTFAQGVHGLAQIRIAGGLAVEDQTPAGTAHAALPREGEAQASRAAVEAGERHQTVTEGPENGRP